jgi:hypothetical protein
VGIFFVRRRNARILARGTRKFSFLFFARKSESLSDSEGCALRCNLMMMMLMRMEEAVEWNNQQRFYHNIHPPYPNCGKSNQESFEKKLLTVCYRVLC